MRSAAAQLTSSQVYSNPRPEATAGWRLPVGQLVHQHNGSFTVQELMWSRLKTERERCCRCKEGQCCDVSVSIRTRSAPLAPPTPASVPRTRTTDTLHGTTACTPAAAQPVCPVHHPLHPVRPWAAVHRVERSHHPAAAAPPAARKLHHRPARQCTAVRGLRHVRRSPVSRCRAACAPCRVPCRLPGRDAPPRLCARSRAARRLESRRLLRPDADWRP